MNSITGYSNPVCVKNINADHLANIEKFVRKNSAEIIQRKVAGEDYDVNCDVLADDEQLADVFGDFYKSQPSNFSFRDGDKLLIGELVQHVKKIVDENGTNSGLSKFKMKKKQKRKRARVFQNASSPTTELNGQLKVEHKLNTNTVANLAELRSYLFARIQSCLNCHEADKIIDLGSLDEDIVSIHVENGEIYGKVLCSVCKEQPKNKKRFARGNKVFYDQEKERWVMSNFQKHFTNFHKMPPLRGADAKKNEKKQDPENASSE